MSPPPLVLLPEFETPRPGAVALWARVGPASWEPVWAEPPRGGLALRLTDTGGAPLLAIMHVPSGYAVLSSRVGGAPLTSNRGNRAALRRALDALLAGTVDWSLPLEDTDPILRVATRLTARVQSEVLPAVPEWRAWRVTRVGALVHRWLSGWEVAWRWASARRAGWWAVEHWAVPPGPPARGAASPLLAWARGEAELPAGMESLTWGAGGASHRRLRGWVGPTGAGDPWEGWP